jgi:phage gp46-like protein
MTIQVRMRDTEGCAPESTFFWDTVFYNVLSANGGFGDWIMAGADDPAEQRGGLRARMAIPTAIVIQLFSDKRLPDGMTPPGNDGDRRGWWGDSVRIPGEPEFETGSLLWTLARSTLSPDVANRAKDYCEEALQPLIDQGAVARIAVSTQADQVRGILGISVEAYDSADGVAASLDFEVLWQQIASPARMTYFAS